MALEPQTTPAPHEPRSAGAQPRPQRARNDAQLDLVRRWQRLLRADSGHFASTTRTARAVDRVRDTRG